MDKITNTIGLRVGEISRIVKFPRGLSDKVYRITSNNGEFVLKTHTKPIDETTQGNHVKKQKYFSNIPAVPKIVYSGNNRHFPFGYVLMEWKPGDSVADNPANITEQFIDDLQTVIKRFSETKMNEMNLDEKCDTTKGDFYQFITNQIHQTSIILENNDSRFLPCAHAIEALAKKNPILKSNEKLNLFTHYDLSEENMLSDGNGLTGIIDFFSSRVGDTNFDKHYALCHLTKADVPESIIAYGLNALFPEGLDESSYHSGMLISQFVALQEVMVLRKRIQKTPGEREILISNATQSLKKILEHNRYGGLLNDS